MHNFNLHAAASAIVCLFVYIVFVLVRAEEDRRRTGFCAYTEFIADVYSVLPIQLDVPPSFLD